MIGWICWLRSRAALIISAAPDRGHIRNNTHCLQLKANIGLHQICCMLSSHHPKLSTTKKLPRPHALPHMLAQRQALGTKSHAQIASKSPVNETGLAQDRSTPGAMRPSQLRRTKASWPYLIQLRRGHGPARLRRPAHNLPNVGCTTEGQLPGRAHMGCGRQSERRMTKSWPDRLQEPPARLHCVPRR